MDKPVTKRELLEVLDLWGTAFEARVDAKFAEHTKVLSAEFARHADRILDEAKKMVGGVDEDYNDLPKRVDTLEAKAKHLPERVAALEAKAFPPKRQRRR